MRTHTHTLFLECIERIAIKRFCIACSRCNQEREREGVRERGKKERTATTCRSRFLSLTPNLSLRLSFPLSHSLSLVSTVHTYALSLSLSQLHSLQLLSSFPLSLTPSLWSTPLSCQRLSLVNTIYIYIYIYIHICIFLSTPLSCQNESSLLSSLLSTRDVDKRVYGVAAQEWTNRTTNATN